MSNDATQAIAIFRLLSIHPKPDSPDDYLDSLVIRSEGLTI